ncbi:trace amine-associated receptor 13c-like [Lepisosteus oculatus]|uniref:trace amine-associated receptor 13c-like n=1 Tax=Lepisosteus oculatus TaxID=7918 RepID=UPI0035F52B6D
MEVTRSEETQLVHFCFPSNNASCHKEIRSTAAYVSLYTVMAVAVGLTVCGNLLVIISISHFKQLHTPTNLLLLSLAVADFLVGATVMPLSITTLIETCWYFGDILCSFYKSLDCVLISVSLCNLVLIAIDRYFAVCDPFFYSTKITVNVMYLLILLSWFISPLYVIILLYVNGNFSDSKALNLCLGECVFIMNETWATIDMVTSFILPCSVMTTLYIKIFIVAKRHAKVINSLKNNNSKKEKILSKTNKRKAEKTLGIVVFAFLLCWVPYYIWSLIIEKITISRFISLYFPCVLVYLNSSINPIIYALFYPWFQKSAKLILTFKICYIASSFNSLFPDNK